jgi:hypothetical protein
MMLVHHLLFPLGYGVGLYVIQPSFGLYVMSVFQLCEFTTPFLHVRNFLSTLGLKSTKAYLYNGILFTLSFVYVDAFPCLRYRHPAPWSIDYMRMLRWRIAFQASAYNFVTFTCVCAGALLPYR